MQELSIEKVAGEYRQGPWDGEERSESVILYSEQDAAGGFVTDRLEGGRYIVDEWSLGEESFDVRTARRGEKPRWVTATEVEYAADGKVMYFELHAPGTQHHYPVSVSFTRAEPRRIRHIPGSYYEGKVTLTFH